MKIFKHLTTEQFVSESTVGHRRNQMRNIKKKRIATQHIRTCRIKEREKF